MRNQLEVLEYHAYFWFVKNNNALSSTICKLWKVKSHPQAILRN
jgi:hypothetical protein